MLTAKECLIKYGPPRKEAAMIIWRNDGRFNIPTLPNRIYLNRDLKEPFETALNNIIDRGLVDQFETFNGCFNIRGKKSNPNSVSLHSWGVAIDINAATNPFNKPPIMSKSFVECFTDAGFDWGGYWQKPDGMHFQLARI